MLKKELLEILRCPACKGHVEEKGDGILCLSCGKKYPVKDDIPIMLVEEAENTEQNRPEPTE